ncbi:MAG: AAA family ATPase, partial [Bacteroidaceae bacterium]|nr:AAA family ATPase [Bacteroidaceae bacterium]
MNQNALSKISEALSHAGEDPRLQAQLQRLEARRITPDTLIPPREFLFRLFSIPCFPRGELVAITGKEKSGKTFVTSLLMTLCVRREALSMARNVDEGLRLLWYDTEQSEESTQEILVDRIRRMICQSADLFESAADSWLDRFFVYNVRSESWRDRLPLLETAIVEHHPDLVVLDGIRDLVDDINDGVLSQSVVERLMHLASDGSCCIVC